MDRNTTLGNISQCEKIKLSLQWIICFGVFFLFLYPAAYIFFYIYNRYRIADLKKIHQEVKAIKQQIKGPLLICANHLTYYDPILIAWALGSFWDYMINFHTLAWNIPKESYARSSKFFKLIFYIGKTIPIDREGSAKKIAYTMHKVSYLLNKGHYVMIFPEGTRSKINRVDTENFSYGVGSLLRQTGITNVLCVYLRGQSQASCDVPAKRENFFCNVTLIQPKSKNSGIRADRDLSTQIIQTLAHMEQTYLSKLPLGK